jgi:WD40 repeat protein
MLGVCSPEKGELIASGDNSGVVKVWDSKTGQLLHTMARDDDDDVNLDDSTMEVYTTFRRC